MRLQVLHWLQMATSPLDATKSYGPYEIRKHRILPVIYLFLLPQTQLELVPISSGFICTNVETQTLASSLVACIVQTYRISGPQEGREKNNVKIFVGIVFSSLQSCAPTHTVYRVFYLQDICVLIWQHSEGNRFIFDS